MPENVLLVEDNLYFRMVLKAVLNTQLPSVRVSEADGEQEALAVCQAETPNLILMDLKLADGDGLTLTRRIKQTNPNSLIVVMTNHDSPEYENAVYSAGADVFISKKSASPDQIVQLAKSAVNRNV